MMTGQITTSLVMATYNGEKFIVEQLESLKNQTKKIDEVLIYDDCSTDQTALLVQDFIKKNNLDNWILKVNKVNCGWRTNFMRLLSDATCEIIFTCDQDDIWMPNKIEIMSEQFINNNNIAVLVSDYTEIMGENGVSAKLRDIKTNDDQGNKKVIFSAENVLLKRPGCVFAIRKDFVDTVQRYYNDAEKSAHDVAMWKAALLYDRLYYLPLPTIKFRRHAESSFQKEVNSAKKQSGIYDDRINTLNRLNVRLDSARNFLLSHPEIKDINKKEKIILAMEKQNLLRIENLSKKSLFGVIKNSYKYERPFNFFADMYHILKVKRS